MIVADFKRYTGSMMYDAAYESVLRQANHPIPQRYLEIEIDRYTDIL